MGALEKFAPLAGRVGIAWLFIPNGWAKIAGFAGTVGYISSKGLPMPSVLAVIALVIEVVAGVAVLVGYRTRVAAAVLAIFTLAAALFFHDFWAVPEAQQMMQKIMFDKNIAIAGGLLFLVAWGAGAFSVDGRSRT